MCIRDRSKTVEKVQNHPGRKVQSLTEASFDTWIKFYRPDENSNNTRISYYAKGTVAAFLLDAKIRSVSKGKQSLDNVMRKMYEKYSTSGYTQQEFRDMATEVAGVNLDEWFAKAIDSTSELDFSEVATLGIEVVGSVDEKSEAENQDENDGEDEDQYEDGDDLEMVDAKEADVQESEPELKPWVGIGEKASGPSVIVSSVTPDSPAYKAGIQTDDELIAVNDFRLNGELSKRLEQFEVGDPVEFLLARRGQLLRVDVTPAIENEFDWSLDFIEDPNKRQEKSLRSWLGE